MASLTPGMGTPSDAVLNAPNVNLNTFNAVLLFDELSVTEAGMRGDVLGDVSTITVAPPVPLAFCGWGGFESFDLEGRHPMAGTKAQKMLWGEFKMEGNNRNVPWYANKYDKIGPSLPRPLALHHRRVRAGNGWRRYGCDILGIALLRR